MGLTTTTLALSNPCNPELDPVKTEALAATGVQHLCIPAALAIQLQLHEVDQKVVTLADGNQRMVPYVGPVKITFKNRIGFTGALVMGDMPLMGTIPMDDMDLTLTPKSKAIEVNPQSPNVSASVAR